MKQCLVVGAQGCGKSSLMRRFCGCRFDWAEKPTIAFDCVSLIDNAPPVQFWDTSGDELFQSMQMAYLTASDAIIGVFDLSQPDSLTVVRKWFERAVQLDVRVFLLVGTKRDLLSAPYTRSALWQRIMRDFGAIYFETSALSNEGVKDVLRCLSRSLLPPTPKESCCPLL